MNEYSNILYKNQPPAKTINNIRNILFDLDLMPIEQWYREEGMPKSVRLSLPNLPIGTNGKGINEEYSLASAYAEFMERIQNLILVDGMYTGNQVEDSCFQSDFKPFDYELFKKDSAPILKKMIRYDDIKELDAFMENTSISNNYSIPFLNCTTGETEYFPRLYLKLSVGSNGMCAGNTPDEALIQGICEIFERYVLMAIYDDPDTSLPLVPEDFLKSTRVGKYFEIAKAKGYELIAKDCSLGGKFPVAGVLLKKGDKALLNLGSAPDFIIALERCITELMQGMDFTLIEDVLQPIASFDGAMDDNDVSADQTYQNHYYRALQNGQGGVPPWVFDHSEEFKKENLFESNDVSTSESLKSLIGILKKNNDILYVREVSFLGFPSYQVYIPGMSEIMKTDVKRLQLIASDLETARKIFYNLSNADKEQVLFLIETIKKICSVDIFEQNNYLSYIHNLSFNTDIGLVDLESNHLLSVLYYKIGDYESAYALMDQYLKDKLGKEAYNNPPDFSQDHFCLLKFYHYLGKGHDLEMARNDCKPQFEADTVDEIYDFLSQPEHLSEFLNIPNCENCDECEYESACNFRTWMNLKERILKRQAENPIDQKQMYDFLKYTPDSMM